jgi:hypothetical protein
MFAGRIPQNKYGILVKIAEGTLFNFKLRSLLANDILSALISTAGRLFAMKTAYLILLDERALYKIKLFKQYPINNTTRQPVDRPRIAKTLSPDDQNWCKP